MIKWKVYGGDMSKLKILNGVENVYLTDEHIIITGSLVDGDDDQHNCDEMGCSSTEHIIFKACIENVKRAYNKELQEKDWFLA